MGWPKNPSISHLGRAGESNFTGLKSGQIKTLTLKLILDASKPGAHHYWDSESTGWLSIRIMCLSGISGHDADALVSQWCSTIK